MNRDGRTGSVAVFVPRRRGGVTGACLRRVSRLVAAALVVALVAGVPSTAGAAAGKKKVPKHPLPTTTKPPVVKLYSLTGSGSYDITKSDDQGISVGEKGSLSIKGTLKVTSRGAVSGTPALEIVGYAFDIAPDHNCKTPAAGKILSTLFVNVFDDNTGGDLEPLSPTPGQVATGNVGFSLAASLIPAGTGASVPCKGAPADDKLAFDGNFAMIAINDATERLSFNKAGQTVTRSCQSVQAPTCTITLTLTPLK